MFLKKSLNSNFILNRGEWLAYFDENNVLNKSKLSIRRSGRKIKNYENFILFKRWILWRWITKNFTFDEKFINGFFKLVRKMDISLTSEENRFIFNVQEIYFNSWRPLKELPVRFQIEPKELINFKESSVNVHKLVNKDGKVKAEFENNYDLYFSFKNIYFCDSEQKFIKKVDLKKISKIELKHFGVIITISGQEYLFRGANKLLVYSILQRVMPTYVEPLNKFPDLYGYFDFWSKIQQNIL
ncbi:hypothetical protein [Spiroplasma alleghenense]|uniref:Uncharacterized protein n=1 Tax=Spiroplasma alleghenense TaxID=216931 RepID=A0A345Z2K0_9MOLU|nr:hypothetical protein [Spiroplasma alleghenense]AXK50829.1 hypothetical protein SALLE_v1c01530 [Spiroplasma alleghenense]